MISRYNYFFLLFFFEFFCIPFSLACKSITVRVFLLHIIKKDEGTWHLTSKKGFWVHAATEVKKKQFFKHRVTITVKKGHLFCNGKKVNQEIMLKPVMGYADCNGIAYDGFFSIIPNKETCLCINHVDLEDYIVSVLRTESWPGWPLEVNKVFAITCRSYVVAKIFESQKTDKSYHVKNTNVHQTYRGKHDVTVLKHAVEQTKSVVLGFNRQPILAMFDSCCGGVVPAYIADVDFRKAPYLARTHACTHCSKCSLYSWNVSYALDDFERIIKPFIGTIGELRDIYVIQQDHAGLIMKIMVKGSKGYVVISGKQLYSALKEVKSFYFDIHKKGDAIVVAGWGFGHHLGLCQWGARQMVRDGWDYKSILHYYYPNTSF